MKLEWAIFWWMFARCIFIGLPDYNIDWFPLSDDPMPISSYAWVNIEMVFMVWLCWQWYDVSRNKMVGVLVLVLLFDWGHFLIGGNSMYFKVGISTYEYPMTNNVLMLIFWGLFALKSGKNDL